MIELTSPLAPDECEARLHAAIDRGGLLLPVFGTRQVVGRVYGQHVRLRMRISYRNSFQTFLTGTLEPRGAGTAFKGAAGTHPFVVFIMCVWFLGVAFACGGAAIAATRQLMAGGGFLWSAIIPALMLVFGAAIVSVGRYLARDEERLLVRFLAETIDAVENTPVVA